MISQRHQRCLLLTVLTLTCFQVGLGRETPRHDNDQLQAVPVPAAGSKQGVRRVMIDTDAGIDDGFAIFHMLAAEKLNKSIKIEGITCLNGNIYIEYVVQNVLNILKTAGRLDIPVYAGLNKSITTTPLSDFYYGYDGFGDIDFPDPPDYNLVQKSHAVQAMGQLVTDNPGEISIVALGPLTNIALAMRLFPSFARDVADIYVLGGAVEGHGNIAPGIEFNVYQDPEAVYIVLTEVLKPIVLVPWDSAFNRVTIPMSWRKEVLAKVDSKQMALMNMAEHKNLQLNETNWVSSDALLAGVFVDNQLITKQSTHHVDVELQGPRARGSLFVDYDNIVPNTTINCIIVINMDIEQYKQQLITTMSLQLD